MVKEISRRYSEETEQKWISDWGTHIEFSHGKSNSKGVAILFTNKYDFEILNVKKDEDGRFLMIEAIVNDNPVLLVNVYAPTQDDTQAQFEFIRYIHTQLQPYVDKDIIMGGDFNMYADIILDKNEHSHSHTNYNINYKCFEELVKDQYNLVDIWRNLNQNKKRFTWRGYRNNRLIMCRLDYWLISAHIGQSVKLTDIIPSIDLTIVLFKYIFHSIQVLQEGKEFGNLIALYYLIHYKLIK